MKFKIASSAGIRAMYRNPYVIQLERRFAAYDAAQLLGEIDLLGLNRRGTLDVLRDRLIRYMVKQFRPQHRVPWDNNVDLRPNDELPFTLNAMNAEISFDPVPNEVNRDNMPLGNVNTGAGSQNNISITQVLITTQENWRSQPRENWRNQPQETGETQRHQP